MPYTNNPIDVMQKVYTLPDLPLAPYSDAQALLRRFVEYRDFSALRPLLDELEALGEKETRRHLFNVCLSAATEGYWIWNSVALNILIHTGHLLYSVEGLIDALSSKYWPEPTSVYSYSTTGYEPPTLEDIQAIADLSPKAQDNQ